MSQKNLEPEPEEEVQKDAAKPLPKDEAFRKEVRRTGATCSATIFVMLMWLTLVSVPESVKDDRMFVKLSVWRMSGATSKSSIERQLTACAWASQSKGLSIALLLYQAAFGEMARCKRAWPFGIDKQSINMYGSL